MFLVTQSLSLVLNLLGLLSALRSGGSLLYHITEVQHQLLPILTNLVNFRLISPAVIKVCSVEL